MKKLISLENNEAHIPSIAAISIALYFAYTLVTARLYYFEFSLSEIVMVSFLFLGIMASIGVIFLRFEKLFPLNVNFKNIITAIFVFLILAAVSATSIEDIQSYFFPFILRESELGIAWNHDTAMHVSLIQSILNFGYPSIAQHGHPLRVYHVLSHYTDALILKITGLEPYDSYGLFVHFKFFTFVSSIVLAISAIVQRQSILVFLLSIILLMPLVMENGSAVGSHGLWMASIVLLLSAPFLFSTLLKESPISKSDLFALFVIIVIISLGKVTSGLLLGSLVGTFVWARRFKQPSTYVFGAMLLLFFYIYGSSFSRSSEVGQVALTHESISLEGLYHYFFGGALYPNAIVLTIPILALVCILGVILLLDFNKVTGSALFASVVSAIGLYLLHIATPWLDTSDIWIFQFGLLSALLLMTYSILIKRYLLIQRGMRLIVLRGMRPIVWLASHAIFVRRFKKLQGVLSAIQGESALNPVINMIIVAGLAWILLDNFVVRGYNFYNCASTSISVVYQCNLSRIEGGLDNLNHRFGDINIKLPADLQLSLAALYVNGPDNLKDRALSQLSVSRPLYDLRRNLDEQLSRYGVAKKNVAMFIPKPIFVDALNKFGGNEWDQGLLIYAVTGVQLVHGVLGNKDTYGFADYINNAEALRRNRDAFSIEKSCKSIADVTHIAIINQLSPPKIDIVQCSPAKA